MPDEDGDRLLRLDAAFKQGDFDTIERELGALDGFPNVRPDLALDDPLTYAIYHGPLELVARLLRAGADPNWPADDGFPPLIAALSCAQEAPGATPRDDVHELVELLLDHGASTAQRGVNDYTPLHWAAMIGDAALVDLLLARGADPNAITRIDDLETAFEVAAAGGHHAVAERLQPLTTRLRWETAARAGDVATLAKLMGAGHDIDAKDGYGQTALMRAAHAGNRRTVDWLIQHGAGLDHASKFGLTALMLSIVAGHPPIARRLVLAGAALDVVGAGAPGFAGKTAHDLATERGDTRLAALIEERASDRRL
jgi:ankyrin repeat protein